jgi:protease secretion system outer membrane protein
MRPNKTWRRAVLAGAVAAALMAGADASAIGLLQAYQAALANDPTYKSAFYDNEGGKEYRIIGRSNLLPNLSLTYSTSKNRADTTQNFTDQNGQPADQLTHPLYYSRYASLEVRQPLFNLDALARYKQGKAQTESSADTFEARTQDVAVRAIGAYLDALFAEDQLALAKAQRDALIEQKHVNDRLFEKGEGTKTDMLETESKLDVAEAAVLESQDNVTTARDVLSGLIGAEVTGLQYLNEHFVVRPLAIKDFEAWRSLALAHNPDLQAQVAAIEIAQQEVNKSRAGHAPKLDFVASYSKQDANTIDTYNQDSNIRSVGIQLTMPLYSGGAVSATSRQAVASREKARADLQTKTDKLLQDLRKSYTQVLSSAAKIAALDKAVESSQLLIRATEQSIKGGVRINLDLLNARQQLYTNQKDLAQARYTYLLSGLKLRASAGTLSFDDIQELATYFH